MAVLVDAQGEMLDNIENMVTISSVPVTFPEFRSLQNPSYSVTITGLERCGSCSIREQ